ncbi:MAG: APC family permease, partial [Gemmataceae bacterium]
GPVGGMIASLIVMTSAFGALNGNVLVGPRLLYAMGDDGMAPRWLTALHPRHRTPVVATMLLAGWSCLMVILVSLLNLGKSTFDTLTDYVIFGAVIFETLGVAAVFVLRVKMRDQTPTLPYRCIGYPVVPALYVLIMALVLANMILGKQWFESLVGLSYITVGVLVYVVLFRRRRPSTTPASTEVFP